MNRETIMQRLLPFVEDADAALTDPLILVEKLYARISKADQIRRIAESSSWDYCKQTSVDWVLKVRRWVPITEEAYWYQLGCTPPLYQRANLTMVGEEYSRGYHLTTVRRYNGRYYCCLLTRAQVLDYELIASIPFDDDLPVLGQAHCGEEEVV